MTTFLLSLLVLLLYAAIAMLIIWAFIFFFEKIFNQPVPARAKQLIYCIVALIFIIWFVSSLVSHTPIPAPWSGGSFR